MSETAQNDAPASQELLDAVDGLITGNFNDDTDPELPMGQDEEIIDSTASTDALESDTEQPEKDAADEQGENQVLEEESDIDYALDIPLGDGLEPIKLGAMKDAYQNLERERGAVDKQRMEVIANEQELNSFMVQSGVEIPRGFREHMQRQQEQHLQSQHELMIKMVPETADKEGFAKIRAGIEAVALESNFTVEEISKFSDARVIHAFNRLAQFEAKHKAAQETVHQLKSKPGLKAVKPKPRTKQSQLDKQYNDALKSNDDNAKMAVIDKMLG